MIDKDGLIMEQQRLTKIEKTLRWHVKWHWGWRHDKVTYSSPESYVLSKNEEIDPDMQPDWLKKMCDDYVRTDVVTATVGNIDVILVRFSSAQNGQEYGSALVVNGKVWMTEERKDGKHGWHYTHS